MGLRESIHELCPGRQWALERAMQKLLKFLRKLFGPNVWTKHISRSSLIMIAHLLTVTHVLPTSTTTISDNIEHVRKLLIDFGILKRKIFEWLACVQNSFQNCSQECTLARMEASSLKTVAYFQTPNHKAMIHRLLWSGCCYIRLCSRKSFWNSISLFNHTAYSFI